MSRHAVRALGPAAVLALWATTFHMAPAAGVAWRGISNPPGVPRIAIALLCGAGIAFAMKRLPLLASRPAAAGLLALGPILPVVMGMGVGLLLFQGPTLVLVASAAAAVILARALGASLPQPSAVWCFAMSLAFFLLLGTRLPGPAGPQGDEPHYLLMTQSLLRDGDVDLANQFADRTYADFYAGDLAAHTSPRSPRGKILPVHTPGLPLLLLPGFSVAGYAGARFVMAVLAAATTAVTHGLVRDVVGERSAFATSIALAFTAPLALYAVSIYPEAGAALATAVFLKTTRSDARPSSLLAAAVASAWLPWLHPKFLPLAALGVTLTALRRGPRLARALAVVCFGVSVAGLLAYFDGFYGVASLSAAYGSGFADDVAASRIPRGLVGLVADRQYGLVMLSPVWLLAAPGAVALFRKRPGDVLRATLFAAASLLVGASFSMWWGGACPPGRFVAPALPALALLVASVVPARRDLAAGLTGLGIGVVALAAWAPRALHHRGDGESAFLRFLAPALDLDDRLPSFVVGHGSAVLLAATLAAALALAWRFSWRGLVFGGVCYAAVASATASSPLLDATGAASRLLEHWREPRWSVAGQPRLEDLRLDVRLPEPWLLASGDIVNTRRFSLPAASYRVVVDAVVLEGRLGDSLARIEVRAGDELVSEGFVRVGGPTTFEATVPPGARRLQVSATGLQGRSRIDAVRFVPLSLP